MGECVDAHVLLCGSLIVLNWSIEYQACFLTAKSLARNGEPEADQDARPNGTLVTLRTKLRSLCSPRSRKAVSASRCERICGVCYAASGSRCPGYSPRECGCQGNVSGCRELDHVRHGRACALPLHGPRIQPLVPKERRQEVSDSVIQVEQAETASRVHEST
jgi:hypothetical protein